MVGRGMRRTVRMANMAGMARRMMKIVRIVRMARIRMRMRRTMMMWRMPHLSWAPSPDTALSMIISGVARLSRSSTSTWPGWRV